MFPNADPATDLNVQIFKIYQWVMVLPESSLERVRALSVVGASDQIASSQKIRSTLIPKADAVQTVPADEQEVTVDRNRVVFDLPFQFAVGPCFKSHPEYPSLGDKAVYLSASSSSA